MSKWISEAHARCVTQFTDVKQRLDKGEKSSLSDNMAIEEQYTHGASGPIPPPTTTLEGYLCWELRMAVDKSSSCGAGPH
eukprot:3329133-Amphidinium_carterae.1